jgi:hypothetical protein
MVSLFFFPENTENFMSLCVICKSKKNNLSTTFSLYKTEKFFVLEAERSRRDALQSAS